jgi:transposase
VVPVGDRGYDSDGLDDLLMTQCGIEMIAANRRGRAKTQDGRPLRCAKRRWKIERLFAWLHNCRRVVTPLGATRRELPGHGAARLCPDLAPSIYEIASSPNPYCLCAPL